jgi:hypothetical protein
VQLLVPKARENQHGTYQCRAELCHLPSLRQYGPRRPCRTGSEVVSQQKAWWVWYGFGCTRDTITKPKPRRDRILRESQESEGDSARAAIGLNEAQVELKWQRQSQEQKLQGRCSEPGQRWPIHRMTGRVMTVSAGTAVPLWLQCDRTHRELVLSCCAMPRMRVIYSIHVLLEVAAKHCLSSSSEPRQQ